MCIDPPVHIDGQIFNPRPQPHIGQPAQRQPEIITQRMRPDPLLGQPRKPRIHPRSKFLPIVHVFSSQRGGFGVLRRRIECPRRQLAHVEGPARHIPINVIGGNKVQAPGLHPSLPAWISYLIRIVGIARRQRLNHVEDPPIPRRPRCKRDRRQQNADYRHLCQLCSRNRPAPQPRHQRRSQRHPHQRPIRPEHRRKRDSKRKPKRASPCWLFIKPRHRPQRQRNGKQRRSLSQRGRGIRSRKWTKRRQPKCRQRRSIPDLGLSDPPHKPRQQQAAQQFQRNLHIGHSAVVIHAKHLETSGQKQRIPG